MINVKNPLCGYNFSGLENGSIIYEVLPKNDPNKYRLWQKLSIQTGIKPRKVVKTKYIQLMTTGMLHILPGLLSDGVTGGPDTPKAMRSAFIHDALFSLMMRELLSIKYMPAVNDLFKKTLIEDKMKTWIAKFYRVCLKMFGKLHITKMMKKEDEKYDLLFIPTART